jgi:pyruvate ferredoxin oxidoreductase alpha subunit
VQEVYDLTLSAFRIAEHEDVSLPCIVSYDGFILSHACEPVQLLTPAEVDGFLPAPRASSRPLLDPEKPVQFGEVLFPEWYPDYEYKKHRALADSTSVIQETFAALGELTGRKRDLTDAWYCDDAEIVLLGIGSMMQTALHTARALRKRGQKVGVLNIRSYRPFPDQQVISALSKAPIVAVLDRDIGYGTSGMVFQDVTRALYNADHRPRALNFIIGTGGKDITPASIERCVELARDAKPGDSVLWPDARGPKEGIPYTEGLTL